MDLKQRLNEFLDEQENINDEKFKINDEQQANWALRKIKQLQEQVKETNALAEAEIEKINAWAESENEKAQRSIDYFLGLLTQFAIEQRKKNPKFKSMKLPNGAIRFRKQQPKFHYDDEKLLESLKRTGKTDFIKVKEVPDKAAVKKSFILHEDKLVDPDTGEFIEGVTVEHREEKIEVTPE